MRKIICGGWSTSVTLPYTKAHRARVQHDKLRVPNGRLSPVKTKWRRKSTSHPGGIYARSPPYLVRLPRTSSTTNLRVHLERHSVDLRICSGGISPRDRSKSGEVEGDSEFTVWSRD